MSIGSVSAANRKKKYKMSASHEVKSVETKDITKTTILV